MTYTKALALPATITKLLTLMESVLLLSTILNSLTTAALRDNTGLVMRAS